MKHTLAACAALALLVPATVHAECVMNRAAELPITLWQDKLFVPASINGTEKPFFIDTGAAITALSESTAASLNITHDFDHTADTFGIGGKESHLYIGVVQTLALGGIQLQNGEFPIAAFAQRMADGATPVGGLIGADILSRFDVDIDVPNRRLTLWRVSGCTTVKPDWPVDAIATPMQILPSHQVTIPARLDGVQLDLMLDTGAAGLLLNTRAAARAGATPEILDQSRQFQEVGVNDQATHAWLHIFQRMEVAGHIHGDVRAIIVNNGRLQSGDGLLGLDYLKQSRVWLSYSTATFFTQPQPHGE